MSKSPANIHIYLQNDIYMKIFLTKYLFLAQKHGIRTTNRNASAQQTRKRPALRAAGEKTEKTTWIIGKTIPMAG